MQAFKPGKSAFFVWGKVLGFFLGAMFMLFAQRGEIIIAICMIVVSGILSLTAIYLGRRERPTPVVGGI